jgi:prolyl-tRNA editing enzyme YbaK/EbsC (Cys-tRNA(Pro) deacylase)
MSAIFENSSVQRVQSLMKELGMSGEITALADSARTAKEAADALGIEVGQVASSIVLMNPRF